MVLAMIAALMAISLPMLNHANAQARSAVCQQNLVEIGNSVSVYVLDHGQLPQLFELPPHEPGMSLPELVGQRLQSDNVTFCPSDETERSHVLGTSYHWSTSYNSMPLSSLNRAVDQTLVSDREAFHQGAETQINELVLRQKDGQFRFIVTGSPEDAVNNNKPTKKQDKEQPNKGKGNNNAGGKGKGEDKDNSKSPPDKAPNSKANPKAFRGDR